MYPGLRHHHHHPPFFSSKNSLNPEKDPGATFSDLSRRAFVAARDSHSVAMYRFMTQTQDDSWGLSWTNDEQQRTTTDFYLFSEGFLGFLRIPRAALRMPGIVWP